MDKLFIENTFFNIEDTLLCGQVFSFFKLENKFLIRSANKFAYLYSLGENVVIESNNIQYFYNYFDLERDYKKSYDFAKSFKVEILNDSADCGKGIRILKQDLFETLISFIISQNNNIKRITNSINYLCQNLGEYNAQFNAYAFPTPQALAKCDRQVLQNAGLGYRVDYVLETAQLVESGKINLQELSLLPTSQLKQSLLSIKGVGEKVANCILLFGFSRQNSFPVDTWIEKVYLQDFKRPSIKREKITEYFTNLFLEHSGIIQQYLFHYKRNNLS